MRSIATARRIRDWHRAQPRTCTSAAPVPASPSAMDSTIESR
jgi:hypothetical protein